MYQKWNSKTIEELKQIYPITEDWNVLLEKFPFSTKRGIQMKGASLGLRKPRLSNNFLTHKEDLFYNWTEESAYLLGYLEADGFIKYEGKTARVTFCTSIKDKEYLNLLKIITQHTGKTSLRKHYLDNNKVYETVAFVISSRKWKNFLEKNLRIKEIPDIPEEFLHHYIRGYFDGDGSVFWSTKAVSTHSSFVFGNREYAKSFRDKLEKVIGKRTIYQKTNSKNCWYINLAKKTT